MFSQRKLRNREKGFTLIELLVVIAIIGILSSVILVSLGSARAKARDAKRISDIGQLKNALELYFSSYNRYPTFDELTTKAPDAGGKHYLAPAFMPNVPTDPSYSNLATFPYNSLGQYQYVALKIPSGPATSCLSYHLGATLEVSTADSPVMQSDSDSSGGIACTPPLGSSAGTEFNGNPGGGLPCFGVVPGLDITAEYCYDVTP